MIKLFAPLFGLVATLLFSTSAMADMTTTHAAHWGSFPTPVGSGAEMINWTYNVIFYICCAVAVLVIAWLGLAIIKFRKGARKGKDPAKWSHSTILEIVWTIIPAIIVIYIAAISYHGISYLRTMPEGGLTVDVIAYQFGWDFDYPDYAISSPDPLETHKQLSSGGTDRYVKDLVVPVGEVVKLNITARDVIHAFYAPQLGLKVDAIPGRINYLWFKADKAGNYIGQCAELCGSAHGEMFFNVKAVDRAEFDAWLNKQRDSNGLEPLTAEQITEQLV